LRVDLLCNQTNAITFRMMMIVEEWLVSTIHGGVISASISRQHFTLFTD